METFRVGMEEVRGGEDEDGEGSPDIDLDIQITLRRDIRVDDFETREEYEEEIGIFREPVRSRFFGRPKEEIWWILIGHV